MPQPQRPITRRAVRTVAVTGGTGFIGRQILDRLQSAGIPVRALTRRGPRTANGIEWCDGELADRSSLERLVAGVDAVIHCAGAVRGAGRREFFRVNVDGLACLVEAMQRAAPSSRLLHLSSLAAREPQLSHYACSKRAAEQLLGDTAGLEWTGFRPPAVYGPGDRELKPVFERMRQGYGVVPRNSGRFSLLHVTDLAAAVLAWLDSARCAGCQFELHDGRPGGYDWDAVLSIAARLLGRRVRKLALPAGVLMAPAWLNAVAGRLGGRAPMLTPGKVRELFFPDWTCSNEALTAATGWRPAIGLEQGLEPLLASAH